MRLIRCRIENFGKLEGFQYDFSDGLTVLQQPNGFGKTTFAAFIKAMFYGLPKTGSRTLAANERRRYEPWQGGIYGGYLEFEYEGTAYRVTRQFGATASKDRFSLIDLSSRKPSTRFSERLGEELFQLDAESFARSVFLSSPDHAVSATTSIRTKLSNLVDNTNDLNNYDTAMDALKKVSTEYRAQRGNGGRINELALRIEALEEKKYAAEAQKPRLHELEDGVRQLRERLDEKNGGLRRLREQIKTASSKAARLAEKKQLLSLRQDVERAAVPLRQLRERYPKGLPSREEIQEQRSHAAVLQQLNARLQELTLSEEDRILVETERESFSDPVRTARDIEDCQAACSELDQASARLHAQMLPEELRRLAELSAAFPDGAPDEETLLHMQTRTEALRTKELRLAESVLPETEQSRFAELRAFFADGEPDDDEIERCEKQQQEISGFEAEKKAYSLTPEEAEDYRVLSKQFAAGVPEEAEITAQQQAQKRIGELNAIKSTKTAVVPGAEASAEPKTGKTPLWIGVVGILLMLAGIVCVFAVGTAVGVVLLTLGLAALVVAFWLHTQGLIRSPNTPHSVILGSAITEEQTQELYDLQHGLNDFLLRFYEDASQPEQKLLQLLMNRKSYLTLKEKKTRCDAALDAAEREIALRKKANRDLFSRYYHGQPYWDGFTNDLMRKHSDYTNLNRRVTELERSRRELSREIEALRAELKQQIAPYGSETADDPQAAVQRLREDAREYGQLQAKREAMLRNGKEIQARAARLEEQIRAILAAYRADETAGSSEDALRSLRKRFEAYRGALFRVEQYQKDRGDALQKAEQATRLLQAFAARYQLPGTDYPRLVQEADDAARRQLELSNLLQSAQSKLSNFLAETPTASDAEAEEEPDDAPDLDALQNAEASMQWEIDALEKQLRDLKQEHDTLRRIMDELPDCLDQMERLTEQKAEAQRAYDLLIQTQEFLQAAKDRLSSSYVGTVERSFRQYADDLMGGALGQVLVDNDLRLLIDEKGKAREAELFSTGTYECVMLCMRLALIEALFTEEQPFLVLDDPFVNLDDRHTQRALDMVKRIAQKHQILYLVCNSSRGC